MPSQKILMVSTRQISPRVPMSTTYEFEDFVCATNDADRICIEAKPSGPLHYTNKALSFLGLRLEHLPEFQPIRIEKDYDLFFLRIGTPHHFSILKAIPRWQERCKIKAIWIEELWTPMLQYTKMFDLLREFDQIFVGNEFLTERVAELTGKPCYFLDPSVDVLNFCPYPHTPKRTIDFYCLGRRSPVIHEELLRRSQQNPDFHYFFDSAQWGEFVADHVEHRKLIISLINRSKYFLADMSKVNAPEETGGDQQYGPRFFEGAAGGAVLIGHPPDSPRFRKAFDWDDAIVPLTYGKEGVLDLIDQLNANPDRLKRARKQNIINMLRRHDWTYRWQEAMAVLDLPVSDKVGERQVELERVAQIFEQI